MKTRFRNGGFARHGINGLIENHKVSAWYDAKGHTIDPRYRLAAGDADELIGDHELSECQADEINQAIEDWAARDPSGYSEYESRKLEQIIAKILA